MDQSKRMRARLLNQNQNEFLLACALCVYICDKYPYRIMRSNIIFHHINNYCSGICLMRFSLQSDNFTRLSQQKQKQKKQAHTHTHSLGKRERKLKTKYQKDKCIWQYRQSHKHTMRARAPASLEHFHNCIFSQQLLRVVTYNKHFSHRLSRLIPNKVNCIIQDKTLLVSCAYTSFVYVTQGMCQALDPNIECVCYTNLLITYDVKSFFVRYFWCVTFSLLFRNI